MDATGDDGGEVRGGVRGDTTRDTRWMSYRELADFLRVEEESARRRAQRARWPRRPGNDGKARVGVPGDITPDDTRKAARDDGGDDAGDVTPALVALAERQAVELAELRERLGRSEGDAAAARAELERIQAAHIIELNRAVADRDHERTERQAAEAGRDASAMDAVRERDRAEGALIRAAASEAEVKGLREALEEARRPFWRRWIG
jgi:hypothetical protein